MTEDGYVIIKISEDSWRIVDRGVRAFLFAGSEQALLVDTGFGTGNIKNAVEQLTDKPVILVNTHGDSDHIGCNALFEKAYMHPSEFAHYYQTAPADARVSPLFEGDVVNIGGREFEIILIPGHTPGSIALLDRFHRLLLAGDSVSKATIFMFGAFRNIQAYIVSMRKLSKMSGSFDTIYPSHGPFPLEPGLIDQLADAAELVVNGKVAAQDPPIDIPAKMYRIGDVGFYYA